MGLMICGGFCIGSTSSTVLGFIREAASLTAGISSLAVFSLLNVAVLLLLVFLAQRFASRGEQTPSLPPRAIRCSAQRFIWLALTRVRVNFRREPVPA